MKMVETPVTLTVSIVSINMYKLESRLQIKNNFLQFLEIRCTQSRNRVPALSGIPSSPWNNGTTSDRLIILFIIAVAAKSLVDDIIQAFIITQGIEERV